MELFQYSVAGMDASVVKGDGEIRPGEGRRIRVFCTACDAAITGSRTMMRTACESCGWPSAQQPTDNLLPCPRCPTLEKPFHFQRITPLYRYGDAVMDAIVAAKYPANATLTRELALRLAVACHSRWSDLREDFVKQKINIPRSGNEHCSGNENCSGNKNSATVPLVTHVPSPRNRQAHRGGSGTRLLARFFANCMGVPHYDLLATTRPMVKQAWLGDAERLENVRGAFEIRPVGAWRSSRLGGRFAELGLIPDHVQIEGRNVILVDDVMTTGATANEISSVLLRNGAKTVSLAVVALAMRDR